MGRGRFRNPLTAIGGGLSPSQNPIGRVLIVHETAALKLRQCVLRLVILQRFHQALRVIEVLLRGLCSLIKRLLELL